MSDILKGIHNPRSKQVALSGIQLLLETEHLSLRVHMLKPNHSMMVWGGGAFGMWFINECGIFMSGLVPLWKSPRRSHPFGHVRTQGEDGCLPIRKWASTRSQSALLTLVLDFPDSKPFWVFGVSAIAAGMDWERYIIAVLNRYTLNCLLRRSLLFNCPCNYCWNPSCISIFCHNKKIIQHK